jgi:integrase
MGMARLPDPKTPTTTYRGVTIRLYERKDGWKATYQLHGHPRREHQRATQAAAQQAAIDAISKELEPNAVADGKDEVTARALLKEHRVSLTEAARLWLHKNNKPLIEGTAEQVRDRWLTHQKNLSHHQKRSLRSRTRHFEDASISVQELNNWLDDLLHEGDLTGRTVRNIYDGTKQLFKWARRKTYLDNERPSPMDDVDRPTAEPGKKHIYTPEVMQVFLDTAWGMASPGAVAMAITGFTAIRTEEICSPDPNATDEVVIHWEDFHWKEKFIYVRAEVDKNGVARNVPMSPVLIKLLTPLKGKGKVYPGKRLDLHYSAIAAKAGIPWKTNAPRHSAITYDMLLSHSPAEVANRSGNSIQTIESSYRNRGATKDQALAWVKLRPRVKWGSTN